MVAGAPVHPLTIVMYHYVRDLPKTRFPNVKALTTESFVGQLDYLQRHYSMVGVEDVIGAYTDGNALPPRPCLLTFDDGLIDHYVTVFPLLEERGLSAGFYAPARAVVERRLLDVQKLQLVLAKLTDATVLPRLVLELLALARRDCPLPSDDELYKLYSVKDRYDSDEVAFVKRLVNRGLPDDVSSRLCDQLFQAIVKEDEAMIVNEVYMDMHQLRSMARHGMHIGPHGSTHRRLGTLSESEQTAELDHMEQFLAMVYGRVPQRWTIAYPYGDRNATTVSLLGKRACRLGLLSVPDLAPRDSAARLELPRLDTNDLPCSGEAEPNGWTARVLRAA